MSDHSKVLAEYKQTAAAVLDRRKETLSLETLFELDVDAVVAETSTPAARTLSAQEQRIAVLQAALEQYFGSFDRAPESFRRANQPPPSQRGEKLRQTYRSQAFRQWSGSMAGQDVRRQSLQLRDKLLGRSMGDLQYPDDAPVVHTSTLELDRFDSALAALDDVPSQNIQHAQRLLHHSKNRLPAFEKGQIGREVAWELMNDTERARMRSHLEAHDQPLASLGLSDDRGSKHETRMTRWARQNADTSVLARIYLRTRERVRTVLRHSQLYRNARADHINTAERFDQENRRLREGVRALTGPEDTQLQSHAREAKSVHTPGLIVDRAPLHPDDAREFPAPDLPPMADMGDVEDISDTLEVPARHAAPENPQSHEDMWEERFALHLRDNPGQYELQTPPRTQTLNALINDRLPDEAKEVYRHVREQLEARTGDGLGDMDRAEAYHNAGLPTRDEIVRAARRAYEHHVLTQDAEILQHRYRERAYDEAVQTASKFDSIGEHADCIEMKALTQEEAETYILFADVYEDLNARAEREFQKGRDLWSVSRDRDRELRETYQAEGVLTPDDRRLGAEHVAAGVQMEIELSDIHEISDKEFKGRLFHDHQSQLEYVAQRHDFDRTVGDIDELLEEIDNPREPQSWPDRENASSFQRTREQLTAAQRERATAQARDESTRVVKTRQSSDSHEQAPTLLSQDDIVTRERPRPDVDRKTPQVMEFKDLRAPSGKRYDPLEERETFSGEFAHFGEIDGQRVAVVVNETSFTTVPTDQTNLTPGTHIRIRTSRDERGALTRQIADVGRDSEGLER